MFNKRTSLLWVFLIAFASNVGALRFCPRQVPGCPAPTLEKPDSNCKSRTTIRVTDRAGCVLVNNVATCEKLYGNVAITHTVYTNWAKFYVFNDDETAKDPCGTPYVIPKSFGILAWKCREKFVDLKYQEIPNLGLSGPVYAIYGTDGSLRSYLPPTTPTQEKVFNAYLGHFPFPDRSSCRPKSSLDVDHNLDQASAIELGDLTGSTDSTGLTDLTELESK